jgi:hypothetical protein
MSITPLKIAVVGHTNTGKTSLLRTLTRDAGFGEVSDRPATTRHVEGTSLLVAGQPLIELYDTPGLEDSIALLDHLEMLRADRRAEGLEIITRFLESEQAQSPQGRFAQEAKALRQVMRSDLALYVIDARDRVLGKHRDELQILSWCARPVVPVLNFVVSPQAQTALWREHLSRANMHAVAEFDTVVLNEMGEQRLLEKMRMLLDAHRDTLDALIADRRQQRERLIRASSTLVADMLLDIAGCVRVVSLDDQAMVTHAIEQLQAQVRSREQRCVNDLLELHRFRPQDVAADEQPLVQGMVRGQWGTDLFSPAALKQFGVRTTSTAAAGALTGLAIDAMVGGISLGAATAMGAALGAMIGAGQLHGRRVIDRLRGRTELRVEPATLLVLCAREAALVRSLLARGHASQLPLRITGSSQLPAALRRVPAALDQARTRPQWSAMNHQSAMVDFSPARSDALRALTEEIERICRTPDQQTGG